MRGKSRVCTIVLTSFLLALNVGIAVSDSTAADSSRTLDWGLSWNLNRADFGGSYGDDLNGDQDGGYNVQTGIAWTSVHADQGWADRYSYLYSVFDTAAGFDGTVWCSLDVSYQATAYCSQFNIEGDAFTYFYLYVKKSTGETVDITLIDYVVKHFYNAGTETIEGTVEVEGSWTAVPGTTYRIYAYISSHVSAVAHSGSDAELEWRGLDVWCQVPPGWGGCVLEGTDILMADGTTAPVEALRRGDAIIGYETSTMTPVTETVLSNKKSYVSQIEVINDGLLCVTPTDQPIYAKNDIYTGWIMNPCDLEVGWSLLNPVNGEWIEITSIEYELGRFTVYEIGATSPDNYVANGLLLDRKPIKD